MLHYIAVNGHTGETLRINPIQKGKLPLAAFTAGTVNEVGVLFFLGTRQ